MGADVPDIAEGRRLLAAALAPDQNSDDFAVAEGRLSRWLRNNAEALLAGTPDLDVERLARALFAYMTTLPFEEAPQREQDEFRHRAVSVAAKYALSRGRRRDEP